jgi:LysR family transcriptional regulator, carnitine catabolism transcriptional activator
MTEKQLRVFVALSETLNFAAAASRVHMSQPALSLSLKNLEDEVGGRLVARTTRQVRLTPEGESLLPRARQLLADWEDTEQMLRQRFTLQRGHVTVAAMPSFAGNVLPGVLTAYRRQYPQVDVAILDVIHEDVLELVAKGRVELGIGFEPESADELHFAPLFIDRFVAALPRGEAFHHVRRISWRQLLTHPFITLQRPSTVRRLLEERLRQSDLELTVSMESHQLATVGALVAAGLGVSAVPALCARQMNLLGARCVPLHGPTIERGVGLITRRRAELSVAARALYETALKIARSAGQLS